MASEGVLSKELEDELRQGASGGELVILPDKKKKNAAKPKKSELEKALETYKPRPEKAVQSLKKDQRMAEEVKAYLKEQKRVNTLKEKQEQEAARRSKREELFDRLQKSALPSTSRDDLQTSSKLSKPIASTERQEGKVGERQRREKSKRKNKHGEEGKASKVFVAMHESSSSEDESSASGEEEETPFNAEEEEEEEELSVEEEETGLLISPTPPPLSPVFKNDDEVKPKSDFNATNTKIEQVVSASKRPRTNSTASNRSDKPVTKTGKSALVASCSSDSAAVEEMLVVRPNRPQDLAESRAMLPVCGMEQEIMEAVKNHRVVFVCGETGSGKTTQVPQFVLEAGFGCTQSKQFGGMVCVSQPRRVAAVSVAERVAQELGCPIVRNLAKVKSRGNRSGTEASDLKGSVGYQIRHDSDTVVEDCTRIKFCTDGILLRECREDFLLRKYSCIILDEVHERGLNSDLLLGMLSRIVPLRESMSKQTDSAIKPLRLILMSATLDVEDFSRLGFGPNCPVVRIETRQHPVVPHFSKRTEQVDYLDATLKKLCRVHEKLPPGGVLVFLPGQREIEWMCRQLKERYNDDLDLVEDEKEHSKAAIQSIELVELGEEEGDEDDNIEENSNDKVEEEERKERGKTINQPLRLAHSKQKRNKSNIVQPENKPEKAQVSKANPVEVTDKEPEEFSDLEDEDDDDEEEGRQPVGSNPDDDQQQKSTRLKVDSKPVGLRPVHVVPLYSRLSPARQRQAFQPSPDPDARVIVVATNIAETSLTIPGIRYVVDCGRERRRDYNQRTGTSSFKVEWISQQSAKQRMGRAGRTGPGHCYRLYSAAVFSDVLPDKTPPEMQLVPVDDLVLYMKSLGIDRVAEFPFPTQLDHGAVVAASDRLKKLGLLSREDSDGRITKLGTAVSKLPLSFRLGKQFVVGTADEKLHSIRTHLVCLAAVMSLPSPFDSSAPANAHQSFRGDGSSDALALLRAAGAFSYDQSNAFCARFGLNIKTMNELKQLYSQLARTISRNKEQNGAADIPRELPKLRPLTVQEETFVKQTVVSGLLDRIVRKMDAPKARAMAKTNNLVFPPRHVRDWPYEPCDDAFPPALTLHAKSFLLPPPSSSTDEDLKDFSRLPEYMAFSSVDDNGRMEGVTACDPAWLRSLAQGTKVCTDAVCDTPEPSYDAKQDLCFVYVKPQFGDKKWNLPIERVPVERIQSGDTSDVAKYAVRAFARALLEGKIAGKFLEESQSSAPFAQCTRPVLQPRVANLVGKLLKFGIVTRKQLIFRWREDPTFLKAEMLDWVRMDGKKRFEDDWSSKVRKAITTSLS